MKKIFALLMIFLLVGCLAVPSFAADSAVSAVDAEPGDTVTLSMQLPSAATVQAGGIAVSYDAQVLELVSGQWKLDGTMVAPFFTDTGLGAFAYASETSVSGEVFAVTFKVRDNAVAGNTVVAMVLELRDKNNATVANVSNGAVITVKSTAATTAPAVTTAPVVTTSPIVTTAPVVTTSPAVTTAPVATTSPVVTTSPIVTAAPIETTAAVDTTAASDITPADTTVTDTTVTDTTAANTTAADTTAGEEQSGGCGALVSLSALLPIVATISIFVKKSKIRN